MADREVDSVGLYQDGKQIVIDLQNYRFPNRCLISGEHLEAEHVATIFYTWGVALETQDARAKDAIKSTWFLGPVQLVGIAIRIPSSSPTTDRSSLLGICLLVGGMFVSIAGVVVTFVGCFWWQWPWVWVALTLVLGSILSFAGLFLLVRKNRPLQVRKFDQGYVWLAGTVPTLLVDLPLWQDSLAARTYRRSRALQRLGTGGVALLVGVLTIASQFQHVVDSISSRNWQVTQGTISSAEIVSQRTETGKNKPPARTVYVAQVNYTFQVAGVVHSGSRLSFGAQASYPNRNYANSIIPRQYPVGGPVTVYYHAPDPSRCTLRIATWREVFESTWPSLLAFFVATWGLTTGGIWLLRERWTSKASEVAS